MGRLTMSESLKYKTIKELVENKINRERAEVILGLKKRRINQLVAVYKTEGKNGFIHGNVGKSPANKIPFEVDEKLIELRRKEFYDFNYLHALDVIKDEFDINVSYTHLYNLWMSQLDPSKEAHRVAKKEIKKALTALLKSEPEKDSNDRQEIIKRIDAEFAQPDKSQQNTLEK